MDKVKLVLAAVKKHHFWALSALVILLGLISWGKATADLAGRFGARKSKLENDLKEMQRICEEPNHPNEAVIKALTEKKKSLEEKVLDAWQVLYDQQKAKNQLPDVLSDEFKKAFEALKPDVALKRDQELKAEEKLADKLLENYQYFINEHFSKLFDIVQILRPAGETKEKSGRKGRTVLPRLRAESEDSSRQPGMRTGREGADSTEAAMVGVVAWDETDRVRIENRFQWAKKPTTAEVLLAQEDLWVYEALLRVIKNTNGDAKTNYDAAVKRIEFLLIGAEVGKLFQGAGGTFSRSGGEGSGSAGGPMAAGAADNLLEGRYVDSNFNPLSASAQQPYAEFKMMPVRMQLLVQQQKIPKLLVECANSTMPIEVRTVRIWPGAGPSLEVGSPTTTEPSGRDTASHASSRTSSHSESIAAAQQEADVKDLPLEIEGIIYIYNPPDKAKLGTGAGTQAAPAEGEPPLETPEEPEPAEPTAAAPQKSPAGARAGSVQVAAAVLPRR